MTTRTYPADASKARIRELNDRLRRDFDGGTILVTAGIRDMPSHLRPDVIAEVQAFDAFTDGNDPYHEHDFGAVTVDGHKIFWKIDCYGLKTSHRSHNPADPAVTRRVLTIMLAEEY